jgi:hypothetical protein
MLADAADVAAANQRRTLGPVLQTTLNIGQKIEILLRIWRNQDDAIRGKIFANERHANQSDTFTCGGLSSRLQAGKQPAASRQLAPPSCVPSHLGTGSIKYHDFPP